MRLELLELLELVLAVLVDGGVAGAVVERRPFRLVALALLRFPFDDAHLFIQSIIHSFKKR